MAKRICWKKGMRLTDDILRSSDNCTEEFVGRALCLAAAGRFGLLPSSNPFELSVNISMGMVDVETLNCLAVTKGGKLIDVHYDTRYTNVFDTRVQIPESLGEKEYILTINTDSGHWKDTGDGYEEPVCSFSLLTTTTPVPENSLPIGRVVDEYGWRMDDVDFVPPCLFVSSHQKYENLLHQFSELLSGIDVKARKVVKSRSKGAISVFWPIVQQLMITVNKEHDMMTPMQLLSNVQKCVSAFTCACDIDDYLELSDADKFRSYVMAPYNYKDSYQRIQEGLGLCFSISEKVDKMDEGPQEASPSIPEAPTIAETQLIKKCTNTKARVQITNPVTAATVYYTTDGSQPSIASKSGLIVQLENDFNNTRKKEPDKTVIVKVMSVLNGVSSLTNTYEITMQKDIERWTGYTI